jgi:plastocyanin
VVIATTITAFHVVGGLLALWAVLLAVLGTMRPDFPGKGGGEKAVIAISVILVIGAIGTAIGTSGEEKPKGSENASAPTKGGKEGSGAQPGAAPAPQTGANQGQGSPGTSGQKPPAGGTAQTLQLSADPSGQLAFDKTTLQATPGPVKIVLSNPAPVPHNVSIEGPGGVSQNGKTVPKGGSSQVSVTLKAGTYTYFCSVPGHRQAGMEGTLTVK